MDFLKLYPIKCLLTASIFCSLSFSENKSKPRYGFYTEENFGNYNFKYSTKPISDDPDEIVRRNYYKNFTSTGLGLSIIDSNYITVLGLRAGAITGEGYRFRDQEESEKVKTYNLVLHSSFGVYDICKLKIFDKLSSFRMIQYLSISLKFIFEKEYIPSDIYIDTGFLQKNNYGYDITINFVGIDYIIPHLKYEKLSKLKKECIGLGFTFYFLN
tara:strand:- start:107 stop:748 length:642 start_codon:yes stop_codon:yes gene_type:complete